MTKYKTGITFGTFDLFHIGHVRILQRAAAMCETLIVGISTDELNFAKKGCYPFYSQKDRAEIISATKYVSGVFFEESLDKKMEYIVQYNADVLIMGDDWKDKFDFCKEVCEVCYLPRTENISTSSTVNFIQQLIK